MFPELVWSIAWIAAHWEMRTYGIVNEAFPYETASQALQDAWETYINRRADAWTEALSLLAGYGPVEFQLPLIRTRP